MSAAVTPSPPADDAVAPEHLDAFELANLILSATALVLIFTQTAFSAHLTPELDRVLDRVDWVICGYFFFDFCRRLRRAPSKARFMKWGWIDLLSCIPAVDYFRYGRILQLVRIIRILRAFRSARDLTRFIYRNRYKHGLLSVALLSSVLILFSSIAILTIEGAENPTLKTPWDAIWWAFTTITTVGYGDKVPISVAGQVVAICVMLGGITLFGTFTGFVTSLFVQPEIDKEDTEISQLIVEIRQLREKIEALETQVAAINHDAGT